jgi:homospermidine synthase
MPDTKHATLDGRLVIVGFGSIGQGVLPLILRHIEIAAERITIVAAEPRGREVAAGYGVRFVEATLTRDNHRSVLEPMLAPGDFLLNVSVEVASVALIELCQTQGALYLDTCIEPWPGGYTDPSLSPSQRSNYALRENALALRRRYAAGPTAVLTHGANPGLVSHFVKQALVDVARSDDPSAVPPADRAGWGRLAARLGVKAIHIAERDTQVSNVPKSPGEFVNTWSIDGFFSEGCQPAELGWGTHEKTLPPDGHRHDFGSDAAIYLLRPGAGTRVRSWTPLEGPYTGFLITHNESISIADFLTVRDDGQVRYRPTCHYAYHPCDDAVLSIHELGGKNWELQPYKRLMMDEIIDGIDELGVLLMGHRRGVYWYGSRLSIDETRRMVRHNNATSLQVTAAVLGGMVWALEHPLAGIVEPEELDFERVLEVAAPYLGPVVGVFGEWTPLVDREPLFPEDLDRDDPWQFKNIRVV